MEKISVNNLNLQLDPRKFLVLLIFAVNLFLVFNFFFPSMRDINVFDESVYVTTGRSLIEGQLPPFARNPLIAIFYAILYVPYLNSTFWLMESIALGRIVLFALMWSSSYLIATQLLKWFPAITMAGFLLIFPVTLEILLNPSDALFAAMSGFAFWQVLCFYNTRNANHLRWGSLFLGLAALSRNDGLVLFVIFILLAVLIIGRTRWNLNWLASIFVPFILLVGGYWFLYGMVTGDYRLGTQERSYTAFQQAQTRAYEEDPDCKLRTMKCAVLQVEELYGTAEENNFSILNAIRRNPGAYFSRLQRELRILPDLIYSMLGLRTAFLFYILFGIGLLELFRRKEWLLTTILLLWPLYLGVYFLTFFRIGYLRMPFYILYGIAAIGAAAFAADIQNKKTALVWAALLIPITIGGMIFDVRALYFASGLLLAVLGLIYFSSQYRDQQGLSPLAAGLVLLLCAGLIMRPTLDPPFQRDLAAGAEEQALLAIADYLPPGSLVASGAPGWVSAARMEFLSMNGPEFAEVTSGREVYELLKSKGVRAVYVDSTISHNEYLWLLLEPDLDEWYQTVYSGREGSIRVLLLK